MTAKQKHLLSECAWFLLGAPIIVGMYALSIVGGLT